MKRLLLVLLLVVVAQATTRAQATLPATNFVVLTHEHVDWLAMLYNPSGTNLLSIVAWQRDAGLDLPTNQVLFVGNTQAMLTLPAGTPFGDAGQPFWILPQSQNPNLLYMGVSAERIPDGVFTGNLTIQLRRLVGPGYIMGWQATGPGQYNIRVNTRDGIGANDNFMPFIGSHEHFNWGFSTTGVYCLTFQAFGQRIGEITNISSPESTFVVHILPLPPPNNYSTWAKGYWPPGFNPPTTLTNGNADSDAFNNMWEYATSLSPTNASSLANAPRFSFVTTNSQKFGALSFTRYKPALDLNYSVEATSTLPGGWTPLTNVVSALPGTSALAEFVTIRDFLPATNHQRFFRLNVNLK